MSAGDMFLPVGTPGGATKNAFPTGIFDAALFDITGFVFAADTNALL